MSQLVPVTLRELAVEQTLSSERLPPELLQAIIVLFWSSLAESTWTSYEGAWKAFQRWCALMNLPSRPIDSTIVALYLAAHHLALKPQTLERQLAGLQQAHLIQGGEGSIQSYLVRRVLRGAKRLHGTRPVQKSPVMLKLLRELLILADASPHTNERLRDGALFAGMWAGAMRCSTAAQIDVQDVTASESGVSIFIPTEKNDPFREGRILPIGSTDGGPTDPAKRILDLASSLPATGPLFRRLKSNHEFFDTRLGVRGIDYILRKYLIALNTEPGEYGTHSFRAGFVTEAKLARISDAVIMLITGHRSSESLSDYNRPPSTLGFEVQKQIGL